MSTNDSSSAQAASDMGEKNKGKQVEQGESGDMSMDDESSGEESGAEEVSTWPFTYTYWLI